MRRRRNDRTLGVDIAAGLHAGGDGGGLVMQEGGGHTAKGTVSCAPLPSSYAASATDRPSSRRARMTPRGTCPSMINGDSASTNSSGAGRTPCSRVAAWPAATVTTAMPAGWAWVTSAARIACSAATARLWAPTGATCIAAPFPHEPLPAEGRSGGVLPGPAIADLVQDDHRAAAVT